MRQARKTKRRVVVAGRDGKETRLEADVFEAESDVAHTAYLTTFLMAILLIPGFFFPPLLMLSLPVLFIRSAMSMGWSEIYESVSLGPFACPECGAAHPPIEQKGKLPFPTTCASCGAALQVQQAPRVNLALAAAQDMQP